MTEREIDYDKSRVEYEFFDKSAETFSVRLIALPNTEILTCAKKDITTIDKEDSGIIEVFLKDRKFRMGYAGTLPGTRDTDIILLDAWCGTGTGGGGGGGDATAANQAIQSNLLTEIRDQQIDGTQKTEVTNFPATQPISAVSLPLPAGAATSANQTLQITQETAINKVLGTQGDAAAGTDIANASHISLTKRLLQRVTTLITDSATAIANWATLLSRIPTALTAGGNFKVSIEEGNLSATSGIDKVRGTPLVTVFTATTVSGAVDALPANPSRNIFGIWNDGNQTVYINFGVNATTGNGIPIYARTGWVSDSNYIITSSIRIVANSGSQSIRLFHG